MKKILYILLILPLMLASCEDENPDIASLGIIPSKHIQERGITFTGYNFSKDYRKINLYIDRTLDAGTTDFSDTNNIKLNVTEYDTEMKLVSRAAQPKVSQFTNVGIQELKRSGLFINVLIDLTQPANILSLQRDYVYKMSKDFCENNLYLTFMLADGKMSNTMLATPYVIENYISKGQMVYEQSDSVGLPYLYRTVTNTINTMEHSYEIPWNTARYKALIIFSDGVVYDGDNNLPIDPEHFQMQLKLIQQARCMPADMVVSFVNLTPENIDPQVVDVNMMKMLCSKAKGQFYDSFSWEIVKDDIEQAFGIKYPNYYISLTSPDEKVFFGNKRYIKVEFKSKKDSVLAQTSMHYSIGSIYSPVGIGIYDMYGILYRGVMIGILLLLCVYIVMQMILPYVHYRMFRKKCVARYDGANMVLNMIKVPKTCYYCKAPFKIGEYVVAKCNHVMHEDCWIENDYKCPEYGSHCTDGSHYYNQKNIFDPKNASFYLKWALAATVAALIAWIADIMMEHEIIYRLEEKVLCSFFNITDPNADNPNPTNLTIMTSKMYQFISAAVYLSAFITLTLSILTSYHSKWYIRIRNIAMRVIFAVVASFFILTFENIAIIYCQLYEYAFLVDWIPWTLIGFLIAIVSSAHSRVKPDHKYLLIAGAGGFCSIIFWEIFGSLDMVNEFLYLIVSNVILAIGIAISIAKDMPRHEHFFLRINGEVKEMEIALYKWLRSSPESMAYIGRSVDCHLQITWDTQSDISPVHAVISHNHGEPTLAMVDGTVYLNGKELKEDKEYSIYHGDVFQIGTTQFKFLDK